MKRVFLGLVTLLAIIVLITMAIYLHPHGERKTRIVRSGDGLFYVQRFYTSWETFGNGFALQKEAEEYAIHLREILDGRMTVITNIP